MLQTTVISDTSCLIALERLDALYILQSLYGYIIITEEISDEFGEILPDWIKIKQVGNKSLQKTLEQYLDKGEASAIALASELDDVLLIIDDLRGRKEAIRLGYRITGTLAVLVKAKQEKIIEQIKPYLVKLREVGFRVSEKIESELLKQTKE